MNSSPDPTELENKDIDYGEQHDILKLHAAVVREKGEPEDGNEPLSLWLLAFFGAALFAGGIYLSLFSAGFKWDAYSIYDGGLGRPGGAGAGPAAEQQELTLVEIGDRVYRQNCVACHQGNGMGSAGVYPPLVGSDWVTGSDKRLAAILLNGIQGPMTVEGVTYNGLMPAWNKNLNDERMAGVITYIRQAWGNTASEVTPQQIAAAREEFKDRTTPWTEAELLAIPADATLPVGEAPAAEETPEGSAEPAEAGTEPAAAG